MMHLQAAGRPKGRPAVVYGKTSMTEKITIETAKQIHFLGRLIIKHLGNNREAVELVARIGKNGADNETFTFMTGQEAVSFCKRNKSKIACALQGHTAEMHTTPIRYVMNRPNLHKLTNRISTEECIAKAIYGKIDSNDECQHIVCLEIARIIAEIVGKAILLYIESLDRCTCACGCRNKATTYDCVGEPICDKCVKTCPQ